MLKTFNNIAKTICLVSIDFYRLFLSFDSGILRVLAPGGACKYNPSCSLYTKQMVEKHGLVKGLRLGFHRILTCR